MDSLCRCLDSVVLVVCPCLPGSRRGYAAVGTEDIDMSLTEDEFQPEDMEKHEEECAVARTYLLPRQCTVFDVLTLRGQANYLTLTPMEIVWFWRCKSFDMADFLMSGDAYRGEVMAEMRDEMVEDILEELSEAQGAAFTAFTATEEASYFAMTQPQRIVTWILSPADRKVYMDFDSDDDADREQYAIECIFGDADALEKRTIMSKMTGPQRLVFMAILSNEAASSQYGAYGSIIDNGDGFDSSPTTPQPASDFWEGGASAVEVVQWPKPFPDTGEITAWYLGDMPRTLATRTVMLEDKGAYLVRDREALSKRLSDLPGDYDLTVNCGYTIPKHYKIHQCAWEGEQIYYIARRAKFDTIDELLAHYTEAADGMAVQLTKPCPRPNFKYGAAASADARARAAGAGIEFEDLSHIFGKLVSADNGTAEGSELPNATFGGTAAAATESPPPLPPTRFTYNAFSAKGDSDESPPPPLPPRISSADAGARGLLPTVPPWTRTHGEDDVDFVAAAGAGAYTGINRNSSVGSAGAASSRDDTGGGGGGDSGIGVTRGDLLVRSKASREADAAAGAGAAILASGRPSGAGAGGAGAEDDADDALKMPVGMPDPYEDEGTDSGSDEPKSFSAASTPPHADEVPPPPPPRPSLLDPDLGAATPQLGIVSSSIVSSSVRQTPVRFDQTDPRALDPVEFPHGDPYGEGGRSTPTRLEDFAGGMMAIEKGMHHIGRGARGPEPEPVAAKVCTECNQPCVGEAKFCPMCGADALEDRRAELWAMGIPVD